MRMKVVISAPYPLRSARDPGPPASRVDAGRARPRCRRSRGTRTTGPQPHVSRVHERPEQDELAVAVDHVFANLVVGLALLDPVTHFPAQVGGEIHLRIGNGSVETLHAAKLVREPQVLRSLAGSSNWVMSMANAGAALSASSSDKKNARISASPVLCPAGVGRTRAPRFPASSRSRGGYRTMPLASTRKVSGAAVTPQLIASWPALSCAIAA